MIQLVWAILESYVFRQRYRYYFLAGELAWHSCSLDCDVRVHLVCLPLQKMKNRGVEKEMEKEVFCAIVLYNFFLSYLMCSPYSWVSEFLFGLLSVSVCRYGSWSSPKFYGKAWRTPSPRITERACHQAHCKPAIRYYWSYSFSFQRSCKNS